MKFFLPKQLIFFELFKELNGYLLEMTSLLEEFAHSFSDFAKFSQKAKEIENLADNKTYEIINRLHTTFITPFDREDIYLLAHEVDDIIDLIENMIHNIEFYQVREKKEIIDDFAKLIAEASQHFSKLINSLQEQKNTAAFNETIMKIHGLEDQGDWVFQKTINQLFEKEKDPVEIIKWKDIAENLERIMDKYQKVGDIIQGIIVKAS